VRSVRDRAGTGAEWPGLSKGPYSRGAGDETSCKGRQQEAAATKLMNRLDRKCGEAGPERL